MKNVLIYLSAAFLFCILFSCSSKVLLLKNTRESGTKNLQTAETTTRAQNIKFNYSILEKGKVFDADFFDKQIRIEITDSKESKNGVVYSGKVENEQDSYVIFTKVGKGIVGNISIKGVLYRIRDVGNGVHQLIETNQSKFKDEANPLKPDMSKVPALKDCPNTDPADLIDVMVVYTQAAETGAGGPDDMLAEIYLAVEETNLGYSLSGINQRISLVHTLKVNYTESGLFETDLPWLKANTTVANDRNTFSADAVVMIEETGNACGLGYFMSSVSSSFDDWAFCVVKRSCATGYYSFGHELGHNMGANHDCGQGTDPQPYVYAHGFNNCGANPFRTVMAYNSCNEPRVLRWSNPNITYNGIACGTNSGACQACNACVLNNTALTVANFRCSSTGTSNVWMRDTWNDNGSEPFTPNNEVLYLSPYIWVRNQQDVSLIHQHEHQNPEFGQSNWVYVKLHNGGNATSGNLEIYYANASLSLIWPGSWTLMTSIPMNISASTTRIAEYEWTILPAASGHYCLLARWNSTSDPMHSVETSDIGFNTAQNNNIVWRNMNIVNLVPDQIKDAHARIIVKSGDEISVNCIPSKLTGKSFIDDGGKVSIKFDSKLAAAIARKYKIEGIKEADNGAFIVLNPKKASIFISEIGNEIAGEIEISFSIQKNTLARYICYVNHVSGKTKSVGGVGYEIQVGGK